ncbi:MAG: Tm-1-like ATP-binding domain-containing protein [Pseudomonadota bacterium]
MTAKNIVVLGTLDTKGEQILFLKERIEEGGHKAIIVDLSMGGTPLFQADIGPQEIAQAAGQDIEEITASRDRSMVTHVMEAGAIKKIGELNFDKKVDGIIAVGGASMALMGSHVMEVLPFGVPKLIVCPAAMPAYVGRWFGTMDVAIMQSIVEFAGLNDMLKDVLARAAGAICGMAEKASPLGAGGIPKGSIAITQFGFSDDCARYVRQHLEERGYVVYPFHANGISDRAMDSLIDQGYFDGVIDIVPAGVIEEIFEGHRASGTERLEAAGRRGIPQVIAPCSINITGCGPTRKHNEKYASRKRVLKIDELRFGTRFNTDELKIGAKVYAEKLNKAKGPVTILIPLKGWSSIDKEGSILYDPEEDRVFVEELRRYLRPEIGIEKVDCNLEDPEFALALVEKFEGHYKGNGASS